MFKHLFSRSFSSFPFHLAIPVHDITLARTFYGTILGLSTGRSAPTWQDYNFGGNQFVIHQVSPEYRHIDMYNPVDGDDVPVTHFGIALPLLDFHLLSDRLKKHNISFIIHPHVRFEGHPGEQWTMFFKDPSNNNLEFKAMVHEDNLFTKDHINE